MKRALRTKSVGTKVSEAELRVLESRADAAGLTLSEWVRDVLLASSVDTGRVARSSTSHNSEWETTNLNRVGSGRPSRLLR